MLVQHAHGSDKHIKLRKMRAHSTVTALTAKSHEAKEVWCILRANADPVQARDRLEREGRLFHGSNQHNCDY